MRSLLPIAVLLAVLATAPAATAAAPRVEREPQATAAACTKGACARRKARRLLADKIFIRFTETGSIGNESSLDQRLHLCGSGDYIYDSVSYIPGVSTFTERITGTWKVVGARLEKGGRKGSARVRGTPDDGSAATTVKISFDGGVTKIDGLEVIVEASDLC
jgi:hypothetical protein